MKHRVDCPVVSRHSWWRSA